MGKLIHDLSGIKDESRNLRQMFQLLYLDLPAIKQEQITAPRQI